MLSVLRLLFQELLLQNLTASITGITPWLKVLGWLVNYPGRKFNNKRFYEAPLEGQELNDLLRIAAKLEDGTFNKGRNIEL